MKISALINTLNEENNIEDCLKSLVSWVDEIIIVDMYSDDRTIEIAKKYTDKIFYFERVGYADPARAFALDKASNEWIIVLDADEIIPKNLSEYLISLAKGNEHDAIWIPRRNFMFGKEIKHTGWGALQDKQMRFFRKHVMSYGSEVHNFVHISENARIYIIDKVEFSIIHFNYTDINHFIEKLNRYTTIEAKQLYRNNYKKITNVDIIKEFIKEFFLRYFRNKGFKDGFYGLYLSILMGVYKATTLAKLRLMNDVNEIDSNSAIFSKYKKIADKFLIK
ncbi:glycosyltransferase family 2 protein [Acinetobacter sp. ESL0695]|uniref:glycosyltransferase family 2 protein n=1 Tax=Acinetobacter sp. ESL0695 TaxID=2983215 RepID=UPI0023F176C8|nr:glycosyltransferase family 2 protein [Acinetobacter sp. ESL0695]WEV48811.1 glycosyltransferase family 2 protein [Acinetobacter sp. ESL0695]